MKTIKSAAKSIKNAIKKNLPESKLGKILLTAALVYVGGAALGKWSIPGKVPFASKINGAFVKGAATTTAAAPTAVSSAAIPGPVATTAAAPAASATTSGIVNGIMPQAIGGTAPNVAAAATGTGASGVMLPGGLGAAAETGVSAAPPKGIISRMMEGAGDIASSAGKFAAEHPLPTAMMLQGAASAAGPDEIDIMREQQKQQSRAQEIERERVNQNLAGIKNIDIGAPMPKQPLRFFSTGEPIFQSGLINSNRGAA